MADEHDSWLGLLGINLPTLIGGNRPGQAAPPPNPPGGGAGAGIQPVGAVAQPAAGGTPPAGGGAAPPPSDAGNYAQGVADRIATKIKAHNDLKFDIAMLSNMDMPTLLDVMDRLKRAGVLDEFPTGEHLRIGAAMLTAQGDYDAQWQGLFKKLNDADQQAILARVPSSAKASLDDSTSGGSAAPPKPGDPAVDTSAVSGVGPGDPGTHKAVAETQVKLTIHSAHAGNLGETEFTVHIGEDGKLTQLEADITAIKISEIEKKIDAIGLPASKAIDLEATLSFNTTVNIDQQDRRLIVGKVQAQAKAELAAHFTSKKIPGLQKIAFKLNASGGSGGFSWTGGFEISFP